MSAKNSSLIRQTVDLDRETLYRFKEYYPHTSLSGLLSQLFTEFMRNSNDGDTMKDHIKSAADTVRERLG